MDKRRGRPTKAPIPGERVSLGLRVTAELKDRLERSAAASGRSQSQEAEYRIEQSFDREDLLTELFANAFGLEAAGIVLMIGRAFKNAGMMSASSNRPGDLAAVQAWASDPYAYDQAMKAVIALLEAFRPEGSPEPSPQWASLSSMIIPDRRLADDMGLGAAKAELDNAIGQAVTEDGRRHGEQYKLLLGALLTRISGE